MVLLPWSHLLMGIMPLKNEVQRMFCAENGNSGKRKEDRPDGSAFLESEQLCWVVCTTFVRRIPRGFFVTCVGVDVSVIVDEGCTFITTPQIDVSVLIQEHQLVIAQCFIQKLTDRFVFQKAFRELVQNL